MRLFDLEEPTAISIAGHEGQVRFFAGNFTDEIAALSDDESALLSHSNGEVHVEIGDLRLFARDLRIEPSSGGSIKLAVLEGKSTIPARAYEGEIFASASESSNAVVLINHLDLEDYIAAVVSQEYGFDDLEGAKAMAVIIRTYTLATLGKYGSDFDHVDHTLSQVYRGSEGISPTIRQAVSETTGEVLTHNGKLIEAVYFAASGGHTADNESVWNSDPLPYLRGKPDPYGASSPHSTWTARLSREQLLSALSNRYGSVTGFVIDERSSDGRVATVRLLTRSGRRSTITANQFRMVVIEQFGPSSLRSTHFDARRSGDHYVFEGKGYGHGVGLSQWGARDMALRNASYREILDFYYTDVRLATLDDIDGIPAGEPHLTLESTTLAAGERNPQPRDILDDEAAPPALEAWTRREGERESGREEVRAVERSRPEIDRDDSEDRRASRSSVQRDDRDARDVAGPPVRRIGW